MSARRAELNPATLRPEPPPLAEDAANNGVAADGTGRRRPGSWPGARVLAQLLQWQPFLDLHERGPYPNTHPVRGELCFLLDLVVRACVIGLMLFAAMALAWKALAPLPPLFSR